MGGLVPDLPSAVQRDLHRIDTSYPELLDPRCTYTEDPQFHRYFRHTGVDARTWLSTDHGRLAHRLNDSIKPAVFGFQDVRIHELARRHAAVWLRVDEWHQRR